MHLERKVWITTVFLLAICWYSLSMDACIIADANQVPCFCENMDWYDVFLVFQVFFFFLFLFLSFIFFFFFGKKKSAFF